MVRGKQLNLRFAMSWSAKSISVTDQGSRDVCPCQSQVGLSLLPQHLQLSFCLPMLNLLLDIIPSSQEKICKTAIDLLKSMQIYGTAKNYSPIVNLKSY
jgi:hypothetical protein